MTKSNHYPSNADYSGKPFQNLVHFFNSAATKLKKPKLTIKLDLNKIVLALAPTAGRYPGCIHISDGGGFGNSTYYGRINTDGSCVWRMETSQQLKDLVLAINENPVREAKLQGQQFGHCMFCGIELTTKESLFVGYGPICAGNWDLPWGETGETAKDKTLSLDLGLGSEDGTLKEEIGVVYYLQDSRSYTGNCVMWWRKEGKGYTTNIDEAEVFSKEQAYKQHGTRDTDVPHRKELVDKLAKRTVDHQYLNS